MCAAERLAVVGSEIAHGSGCWELRTSLRIRERQGQSRGRSNVLVGVTVTGDRTEGGKWHVHEGLWSPGQDFFPQRTTGSHCSQGSVRLPGCCPGHRCTCAPISCLKLLSQRWQLILHSASVGSISSLPPFYRRATRGLEGWFAQSPTASEWQRWG